MIELENLNNRSLEDILEEVTKQIIYLSPEWTDLQEADPGVTLVELFAWLKSVQHEYLNRLSPGVVFNFLKLLDIAPKPNKGSESFVEIAEVGGNVIVPTRTKWQAGNLVFENLHHQALTDSKILSVLFETPQETALTEYYKIDGTTPYFLFGKDTSRASSSDFVHRFTINLDSPLPENDVVNFYFSVYSDKRIKRNPIGHGDNFERMANIKWEFYGTKNGKLGWHELQVISDKTHDFLFSGIIKFRLNGQAEPLDGEYKIRATLMHDEYDYPPRIDKILVNVLRVCQNNTVCENSVVKKQDILSDHSVELFSHLALHGHSDVYYKKHGGWVKTNVPTFKTDISQGKVKVNLKNIWDEIKDYKHDDEVVMIVSYELKSKQKLTLGSGSSMSGQYFETEYQNVLTDDFEIMASEIVDGEEVFYKWNRVENFFASGKYDRHYMFNKEAGLVIFGDHEHGMAPRAGIDNIKICKLRHTEGKNSNVKSGMINSVISKNKILKNSRITQINDAAGGYDDETLKHAQSRAASVFSNPERAVTIFDYERIVKQTPGLTFLNVKILPGYMPKEDVSKQNCVTIAVRWNKQIGLSLPKSFENNIMRQLDKYRLVNTKIKVISPAYVGLIISGEILVDAFYKQADGIIEREINEFVEKLNSDFGQTLHFGDMFGMIDRLDCVSRLNKLHITPIGENVSKNSAEDVLIPPNGIYYIEKIEFNFIKNSDIFEG